MNRKGSETGDMALVFVFGFILFLIVGSLALGLEMFYGQPLDYRYSDSTTLINSVVRCLNNNQINDIFFTDFYSECGISKNALLENKFVLQVYSDKNTYVSIGDPVQCQLQDKNPEYPRCSNTDLSLEVNGHQEILHVVAGSNQRTYAGVTNG